MLTLERLLAELGVLGIDLVAKMIREAQEKGREPLLSEIAAATARRKGGLKEQIAASDRHEAREAQGGE